MYRADPPNSPFGYNRVGSGLVHDKPLPISDDIVTPFVPTIVLNGLLDQGDSAEVTEPRIENYAAVALMADISGFTKLTEVLVREALENISKLNMRRNTKLTPVGDSPFAGSAAKEAAEDLTGILNKEVGYIVNTIVQHGGDVMKFAGDAILAIWIAKPIDDDASGEDGKGSPRADSLPGMPNVTIHELGEVAVKACSCALEITRTLEIRPPLREGVRLRLHSGLGAGRCSIMHVGGKGDRWEYIVTGDAIAQVGAAEPMAEAGEVVVSRDVWSAVTAVTMADGQLITSPESDGHMKVTVCVKPASNESGSMGMLPGEMPGVPPPVTPTKRCDRTLRRPIPKEMRDEIHKRVGRYIPRPCRVSLECFSSEREVFMMNEMRRITAIFVNVTGIDFNSPKALAKIQRVVSDTQQALYKYGGSMNKFLCDDKGSTLIAGFGMTSVTHADDPQRAVLAALDILKALELAGVRSFIGITTGNAFCGVVGNQVRREYTVMGEVVNRAARFMMKVGEQGGILCDDDTRSRALNAKNVFFETMEPVMLKGYSEPTPVFRPYKQRGKKNTALSPMSGTGSGGKRRVTSMAEAGGIIGREDEVATIREGFRSVKAGEKSMVVVIGDTGMGKSMLCDDACRTAETMGLKVFRGGGDPMEKGSAFHGWRSVFVPLLLDESGSDQNCPTTASMMKSVLQTGGLRRQRQQVHIKLKTIEAEPHFEPLLNSVLSTLNFGETPSTRKLTPAQRADKTMMYLADVLRRSLQPHSPCVVYLENGEALDYHSWALLKECVNVIDNVMFLVASRPIKGTQNDVVDQVCGLPFCKSVRLGPLGQEQVGRLASMCLGAQSLSVPVYQFLLRKCGGEPLFVEEMAYSLTERNLVVVKDGVCQVAAGVDLNVVDLPGEVQHLIAARIDKLLPKTQLILKVASVMGAMCPVDILGELMPSRSSSSAILNDIQPAVEAKLVQVDISQQDGRMTVVFRQAATTEVVYHMLTKQQKKDFNTKAARYYEDHNADEADKTALHVRLANHWEEAEEYHNALHYYLLAAEQAYNMAIMQGARDFFMKSVDMAELLRERGKRMQRDSTLGGRSNRISVGGRARMLGNIPTSQEIATWKLNAGLASVSIGDTATGKRLLEEGLPDLGFSRPPAVVRRWFVLTDVILFRMRTCCVPRIPFRSSKNDLDEDEFGTMGGMNQMSKMMHDIGSGVPKEDRTRFAVRAYEALFEVYYFNVDIPHAMGTALEGMRLLAQMESGGPPSAQARCFTNLALAMSAFRQKRESSKYGKKALDLAARSKDPESQDVLARALFLIGAQDAAAGQYTLALGRLWESMDVCKELDDMRKWAQSANAAALVEFLRGSLATSTELCRQVYQSGDSRHDSQAMTWGLLGEARNWLELGDVEKCKQLLAERETIVSQNPSVSNVLSDINCHATLALAFVYGEDLDAAKKAFLDAMEGFSQVKTPSFYLLNGFYFLTEAFFGLVCCEDATRQDDLDHYIPQVIELCLLFQRAVPLARPRAQTTRAVLLSWKSKGVRVKQVAKLYTQAIHDTRRLDWDYEGGMIYYLVGKYCLSEPNDNRKECLATAMKTFRLCSSRHRVTLCGEAMASIE
eukprot:Rmarinus@m.8260